MRVKFSIPLQRAVLRAVFLPAAILSVSLQAGTSPVATNSPTYRTLDQIKMNWDKLPRENLSKAAQSGDVEAQFFFAHLEFERTDAIRHESGRLIARAAGPSLDLAPAEVVKAKWGKVPEAEARKAAESGDRQAMQFIGNLDTERAIADERKAVEWLKKAAGSLLIAQAEMGEYYRRGERGFPLNTTEALKYLRLAAERGHERSQHLLSAMLIEGDGISVDLEEGITWLQKASDQKCARAQFELAQQYACGNGEPRHNADRPVELLRRAAAEKHGGAQSALATRYQTGLGIEKDYVEAIRWYRLAQNSDDPSAQSSYQTLSIVDDNGEIVPGKKAEDPNFAEVLKLYVKAIDRKEVLAQSKIAEFYATGKNLPRDDVKAFFWFDLAANQGSTTASAERDKLKSLLSEDDLRKLRNWSSEFQ